MPRKVVSGPDYDDDYDDYDEYDDDDDDDDEYDETRYGNNTPVMTGKETLKNSSSTVSVHWTCSMCTFSNHESMVYCEMCGVFRETFVKSAKDGLLKAVAVSSEPRTSAASKNDSAKAPVKTRAVNSDGDSMRKHASMSYDKANSTQLPSAGSSLGAEKKKKTPVLSEEVPVERIALLASDGFQSKGNQNSGASSSSQNDNVIQKLSSDVGQLNVNKNNVNVTKSCLPDEYKPEKWMLADLESRALSQLNLAIVGHVDSGKSTLSGRLLHLLGRISKKYMHKNEKESKEKGKGSFAFAWAMDESSEERERGVTMTVAVAYLETKKFRVVLLDSPGHKDFVPNMISGATQADAAILVVDASTGSFEAGMDGEGGKSVGQTKEHAQLVRSFGVEQLVVAVNKMDAVDYAKERFDFIKLQLGSFLRSCNFKDSAITWIPLSAVENQNLIKAPSDARLTSWYQGFCLLDAIDFLQLPSRDVSKPLIIPICDVIKSQSTGQLAAYGKLETGAIQIGSKVLVLPSGQEATVKAIERDSNSCTVARAGDNVAICLQGIDGKQLIPGGVLCHPGFPVPVANHLELKVLVLDITTPILVGSQVEFHIHHVKEAARVTKIVALLDKTGKPSKSAPRFLKSKQNSVIQVTLDGAVCVQEFSKSRALGRAYLRSAGRTIAVGVVNRIIGQDQN
ncbi:HBS1-like protein isoform X2 [Zea mays]|uniref:HBS1-like protein isoform X2 n=1 Tax=Zea mays TaxID=4577 RepID=UPI0009AA5A16|nr:HBS1-like protein isoform X2 [Zea mays]|eukprot:XP_020401173.1 HBS1-like protein isoform X2 [Zea mays]